MVEFARKPGEVKIVKIEEWNEDSEFGHCPACGSVGMEEGPSRDMELAQFVCSDEPCITEDVRTHKLDTMEGPIRGKEDRTGRTRWWDRKPQEWREREIKDEVYWNETHFSPEIMQKYDLV